MAVVCEMTDEGTHSPNANLTRIKSHPARRKLMNAEGNNACFRIRDTFCSALSTRSDFVQLFASFLYASQ